MKTPMTLSGESMLVQGAFPRVGDPAPDFRLVDLDFKTRTLADWPGRRKVLVIAVSVDTPVCQAVVRRVDAEAAAMPDLRVLVISCDTPYAHKRFWAAAGLRRSVLLSTLRDPGFAERYGVAIADGPLAGLCARAVLVLDEGDRVIHAERVAELTREPDDAAALAAAR